MGNPAARAVAEDVNPAGLHRRARQFGVPAGLIAGAFLAEAAGAARKAERLVEAGEESLAFQRGDRAAHVHFSVGVDEDRAAVAVEDGARLVRRRRMRRAETA